MEGEKVYSTCGDVYGNVDPCDLYLGDTYYSGISQKIKPSNVVSDWTVTTILEQMDEQLYEEVGELAEGNLNLSEDDQKELLDLIKDFMDKKCKISCYKVVDTKEHTLDYRVYTKRSQPQYLHIDVPLSLWQKLDKSFGIKYSDDTTLFMCANEKEREHLESLGINVGDDNPDWFKINLVEE